MLVIHDEELVRQLQALAEQQQRPIEEVLKSLLDDSVLEFSTVDEDRERRIRELKRKAYADARRYWEVTKNLERLQLTDGELDEQGVPRLKSEHQSEQEGSLSQIAEYARQKSVELDQSFTARQSREVLNNHFGEDLHHRKRDDKRQNID